MRLTKLLLAAALVISVATRASAQVVVYDNGPPNGLNGNEMALWLQAEDFTFGTTTTFNQIRFWNIEGAPGYSGNGFEWWIFANNAGNPGAIIVNGKATPTRQAQGLGCCGYARFQNDLFIAAITLGPGTYWLGLHDNTAYVRNEMYWETANPNLSATGHESFGGTMDNWFDNGQQHAFQLLGPTQVIPEPASMTLLATGLVGILGVARRRFKGGSREA